jgi:hypothetical protein
MLDTVHFNVIGFNLFLNAEFIRVQQDGAKLTFGNMENGKFIPVEEGEDWTAVKAKYPDEKGYRIRTKEQFREDYNNLRGEQIPN